MSVLADHDQAIALALRAVIRKFNDLGIYFRTPAKSTRIPDQLKKRGRYPAVDRDRIVSALVTKGAGTHRAVLSLVAEGDGDNAYALARVLLENSLILMWLLGGDDWRVRVDTYALHMAAHHARARELAELYWPEESMPAMPEELGALSAELFNDGWSSWARLPVVEGGKLEKKTLERMSYEMTPQSEDGKRRNSLVYDVAYHHMSAWVHSSRPALMYLEKRQGDRFCLDPAPVDEVADLAGHVANTSMLMILKALVEWAGAPLVDELHAIESALKERGKL